MYNGADIDKSKVVWAQEMGPASNLELLQYFRDRSAWLVQPDFNPPESFALLACLPRPRRARLSFRNGHRSCLMTLGLKYGKQATRSLTIMCNAISGGTTK